MRRSRTNICPTANEREQRIASERRTNICPTANEREQRIASERFAKERRIIWLHYSG